MAGKNRHEFHELTRIKFSAAAEKQRSPRRARRHGGHGSPCISVYSYTMKLEFLARLERFFTPRFLWVTLEAHASCVLGVRHSGHAGSVRSQGRNLRALRVSAVRFFWLRLGCTMKIPAPLAIGKSVGAPLRGRPQLGRPHRSAPTIGQAPRRPFSFAVASRRLMETPW